MLGASVSDSEVLIPVALHTLGGQHTLSRPPRDSEVLIPYAPRGLATSAPPTTTHKGWIGTLGGASAAGG